MFRPVLAALLLGAVAAAPLPKPPPLCRVVASATPEMVPGLYTIRATVDTTLSGLPCPPDGYAYVRLQSGRTYPLTLVLPNVPFERSGIPWYWRLDWRSQSGRMYRVPLPDLKPPFAVSEF